MEKKWIKSTKCIIVILSISFFSILNGTVSGSEINGSSVNFQTTNSTNPSIWISAVPEAYNYSILHTIGILLTPEITGIDPAKDIVLHWHATLGTFLRWDSIDSVTVMGSTVNSTDRIIVFETRVNATKKEIFWNYGAPLPVTPSLKEPVKISLTITDGVSGKYITDTFIQLVWKDDMFRVTR